MNEQELRAAAQDLELYRSQLESMQKQDELLRVTLDEYNRARDALEEIRGKKEGDELLVPIGANCFLHAKLGDPDKAISSLSSNVAVGETTAEAVERLEKHIQEIEKALVETQKSIVSLDSQAQALSQQMQKAYEELEGKGN